jgi:hypothetical protein
MRITFKKKIRNKTGKRSHVSGAGSRARRLVLSGVLAATTAVTPVEPAWGDVLGQHLYPSDHPWNQNISNAPVAANSSIIIGHIGSNTSHVAANWGAYNPATTGPLYGIPYNVVHGNSVAKVKVFIDDYPGESDIVDAPIPANAMIEGDNQNGPNGSPLLRGDSHMIVWDEDNNVGYEFWGVTRPNEATTWDGNPNNGQWHAVQETVWDFKTDNFRTLGYMSADAAGLSIFAGLARPDEALSAAHGGQGVINHALRFALPSADISRQYLYPASHILGSGSGTLPLGSRLRLKNSATINALIATMGPQSQVLAHAMQQYGLILTEPGDSRMSIGGAPTAMSALGTPTIDPTTGHPITWDMTDVNSGIGTLHATDFEVVDLRPRVTNLSATSGVAGDTLIITGQNFFNTAGNLSVSFGNNPVSGMTVLSETQISVDVPSGGVGTVDVRVQSGINEVDAFNPTSNVNAPIFGYGTSAATSADQFTYVTVGTPVPADKLSITASGLAYNRITRTFNGTLTFQNISAAPINGPFELLFDQLPGGVDVVSPSGTYQGKPFLDIAGTPTLAPGQSVTVSIRFSDPTNVKITFTPIIYSGTI